ncbi:MAG TPA: hypothetical protein PK358_10135 [Spirochaetota bacterium]|nr:hypothetical protein [Spirochaetota bacterium]HPJ35183.1 hypothetical protein [Spirochaetota bacterium]
MFRNLPVLLILILSFSIIALNPSRLNAADLSAGATSWYTAWDYEDDASNDIEYSSTFLYGPALSLSMTDRFSLSFVFLYGEFDMDTGEETESIKRYDSDLTFNYRISNYFKLFLGCKYAGFTWDPDGKHQAIGPGTGISAVFPVGWDFFILGYISGIYLWGNEEGNNETEYDESAREYGVNTSLSLAYYISGASTTISLGGRYQQLHIDYDSSENEALADNTSRFYGVTLTAVYSFNL